MVRAYACYNKNEQERLRSSSGGIYPLIAKKILECDGVVFAACYDDELNVRHFPILTLEELIKSQGSKYVSSILSDTFCLIRKELNDGKKVLFVGTPCQCEGLRCYLEKVLCPTDGLVCLDFICHGIPSRKVWHEFQNSLDRRSNRLQSVNMRDKTTGWSRCNYSWKMQYCDGRTEIINQRDVSYMKGFVSDIYLRPSCYECEFKGTERHTDITLGDYWGVWDLQPHLDDGKGTSIVLVHTEKGREMFESITNKLIYEDVSLNSVIMANPSIIKSAQLTYKREKFFEYIARKTDFEIAVNKILKISVCMKIKKKIKNIYKCVFEEIL